MALSTSSKIVVNTRVIRRLEKGPKKAEVIVHFQDGSQETEGFLGHKPKFQLKGPFAQQLGLDMTPMGDIKTDPPFLQTSVRGVFAALDDSSPVKIANALFTGAAVGAGVSAQLQADILGHQCMIQLGCTGSSAPYWLSS
jgi:gliotoxin/aspirochlorine biosynthesis thioredoxin reductase